MSKLQKWCPNYTRVCTLAEPGGCLTGALGYALDLSAPRCPISVLAPKISGEIPSDNAKVLVVPTCLPTTGEGWPKAMRHENACLLRRQTLDYHCHCPPKPLIKFQETGGTVTHTLQVLHSVQWHRPSRVRGALRLKRSPWLATPTLTPYLGLMLSFSQALVAYL